MSSLADKIKNIKVFFEQEKETPVRSPKTQKTIRKIESGFIMVNGKWVRDPKARRQEDPGPPEQQKPF
jgi:hypothetical protein